MSYHVNTSGTSDNWRPFVPDFRPHLLQARTPGKYRLLLNGLFIGWWGYDCITRYEAARIVGAILKGDRLQVHLPKKGFTMDTVVSEDVVK